MRPRCCLRYLTRFGINMASRSRLAPAAPSARRPGALSSTSPWNIHTLTPHVPYAVFAVARAKSMSARSVCSGTRPSRYVSYRAISEPPRRPEQATRMPWAPGAHRRGDRLLHGAAERHALLELLGDVLGHELGVEVGALDLLDVELDLPSW